MDPRTDKLIRRTTMVATCTAAYLLLTADYGPEDNVLIPVRAALKSMEQSVKKLVTGSNKEAGETEKKEKPKA
ncbi:unnamed protein product [Spirodela intermedia]|uniref:Uncharacterized protein n=2 Tax=Spirodela intermedia TaxID=51605 RepID=A0A7I8K1S5_SPIIN|nr:unnamed protein product [Spirodela intermedia]CAA6655599.1 unnamed protein product [Spirodela intermedia]CAA7390913.1 unnamed protein product [Spirodela intermedia]